MRFSMPREFYAPKGSLKVSDKLSDAVAYLSVNKSGRPCATVFFGKQSKPVFNYVYRNDAERERSVMEAFAGRQAHMARVKENRASPSSTATRNAKLKKALEAKYGKGSVSVTGDRGTAYGWVNVKFNFAKPEGLTYGAAQNEVAELAKAAGLSLGHYNSGDYGSGYELALHWE